jgi:hypothetical protein
MAYIAMTDTDVADLYMDLSGNKISVKLTQGQEVPVEFLNEIDVKKSLMFGALGRLIKGGIIQEMDAAKIDEYRKQKVRISPAQREANQVADLYKPKSAITATPAAKYASVTEVPLEEAMAIRNKTGIATEMDLKGEKRAVVVDEVQFEHAVVSDKSGGIVAVVPEKRKDIAEDKVVNDGTGEQKIIRPATGSLKDYEPKSDFGSVSNFDEFMGMNHFDKLGFLRQCENKELLSDISQKALVKQLQNESRKRLSELA